MPYDDLDPEPARLLATCWTTAGDADPTPGRSRSSLTVRQRAEAVADAGFVGIGFLIEDLEADELSLPDIHDLLEDLGLHFVELELLADWWADGPRRVASDEQRRRLLTAAQVLGAHHIKIAPDATQDPAAPYVPLDLPVWAAALHGLAGQAADVGTAVSLEVLPFSNISDFRVAAELITAADHPAAGICADIWHLERGPSTRADLAGLPRGIINAVELNDAGRPADPNPFLDTIHHRLLPGEGDFDLTGFVAAVRANGFDGPWGVEILSRHHRRRSLAQLLPEVVRSAQAVLARTA